MEPVTDYFCGLQNHCGQWLQPWIKRCYLLGKKAMTNLDSILKNRDITWLTKVCTVKAMVFLVIMYRCENEHQRIDAFQLWSWRRLESPLDSKEIKPINPKGNQPWIFTGRTDAEAEAPILWPPDGKHWLTGSLMLGNTFKWLSEKTVPRYTPWWAISN